MTLAAFQSALAELFISQRARDAYARDEGRFLAGFDLNPRELAQLEALARGPIESFARTLQRKQRNGRRARR